MASIFSSMGLWTNTFLLVIRRPYNSIDKILEKKIKKNKEEALRYLGLQRLVLLQNVALK